MIKLSVTFFCPSAIENWMINEKLDFIATIVRNLISSAITKFGLLFALREATHSQFDIHDEGLGVKFLNNFVFALVIQKN